MHQRYTVSLPGWPIDCLVQEEHSSILYFKGDLKKVPNTFKPLILTKVSTGFGT